MSSAPHPVPELALEYTFHLDGWERLTQPQVCQTETGWGLGPLAAECSHLDTTSPPHPQNTKKPSGPKNNRERGQWGQILDKKIQRDQKPKYPPEDLGKSRVGPLHPKPPWGEQTTSATPQPDLTRPNPHPHIRSKWARRPPRVLTTPLQQGPQ